MNGRKNPSGFGIRNKRLKNPATQHPSLFSIAWGNLKRLPRVDEVGCFVVTWQLQLVTKKWCVCIIEGNQESWETFLTILDVKETVLSSEPGKGQASSRPEASLSYSGPGHFRTPPLPVKGRAGGGNPWVPCPDCIVRGHGYRTWQRRKTLSCLGWRTDTEIVSPCETCTGNCLGGVRKD